MSAKRGNTRAGRGRSPGNSHRLPWQQENSHSDVNRNHADDRGRNRSRKRHDRGFDRGNENSSQSGYEPERKRARVPSASPQEYENNAQSGREDGRAVHDGSVGRSRRDQRDQRTEYGGQTRGRGRQRRGRDWHRRDEYNGSRNGRRSPFRGRPWGRSDRGRRQHRPPDDMSLVRSYLTEEPVDILGHLGTDIEGTKYLLKKAENNPHLNQAMLKVLVKCFQYESLPELISKVVRAVIDTQFIDANIERINTILTEDASNLQWLGEPLEESLQCVLKILNKLCGHATSVYVLGTYHAVGAVMSRLTGTNSIDISVIQDLFRKFETNKDKFAQAGSKSRLQVDSNETSREDFRNVPIYPQLSDILPPKPALRAIKTQGKYDSLSDYLDIHFRLLREDFIGSLREGIAEYKQQIRHGKKRKLDNVRIYDNVRILTPVCGEGLNHILSFDISRFRHVKWHMSQRLMYGSLICISYDNFETCYFATVMNDSSRKHGFIRVKFADAVAIKSLIGATFTMAESTAYFEAFRHVLSSLQQIQEGDLPFERYLIECKMDIGILPPKYLKDNQQAAYDLRIMHGDQAIIHARSVLKNPGMISLPQQVTHFKDELQSLSAVQILKDEEWPDKEVLGLDESQLNAVKAALTKEISVIQGPPGCGKTYIGLKIVKTLLYNKHVWSSGTKPAPILIVCFTNHALDQFMEGICEFYDGDILRVGGRSKSETLQKHTLSAVRNAFHKEKASPKHLHKGAKIARGEMYRLKNEVNLKAKQIQVLKGNIVKEEALHDEMGPTFFKQFEWMKYRHRKQNPRVWLEFLGDSVIVEWLEITKEAHSIHSRVTSEGIRHIVDREQEINISFRDEERDNPTDNQEDMNNLDKEKEALKDFKIQNLALDVSTIEVRPKGISDHRWRTMRWERLELILVLNEKFQSSSSLTEEEEKAMEAIDIFDDKFTNSQRWRLYIHWVNKKCQRMHAEMYESAEEFESSYNCCKEVQMLEDISIMKSADVIGMTTTGAAKHQSLLKDIGPAIMVVEEAAEVLEAHLISNLTPSCQQLILIGDHKQLRPKPNRYELEKHFNLDISLFERMVLNQMKCFTLKTQHRMRPEIADVVRFIYEELDDADNVKSYEHVKGMAQTISFLNHNKKESYNEEMRSYRNEHEADFLVALCKYLLLQGYKPSQITVLTTYKGQLLALKKRAHSTQAEEVRMSVVDNYQGEENDIILLSLVRNNREGNVGFLKTDNRLCVALSRAKKGLFVMGNFDQLEKSSDLWHNIIHHAKETDKLVDALLLKCQNHPDTELLVANASDFDEAPKGGCRRPCETRLLCGHVCDSVCHTVDRDHAEPCDKPCLKRCFRNHACQQRCSEKCVCTTLIEAVLPKCQHRVTVKCSENIDRYKCEEKCGKELACGHKCSKACNKECEPCGVQVPRKLPDCGHTVQIACGTDVNTFKCKTFCGLKLNCGHLCKAICGENTTTRICADYTLGELVTTCERGHSVTCKENCLAKLACGHVCKGTCDTCYLGKLHIECSVKCSCNLACGHKCTGQCSACAPCAKDCKRRCYHMRCTKKCSQICEPCRKPCAWKCDARCPNQFKCSKLCKEECDRPRCNQPCLRLLRCKHRCIGICGEPCPTLCRKCNAGIVQKQRFIGEDVQTTRFIQLENCGHIFRYDIMDEYMDKKEDGIGLKRCPECNTPILLSRRYSNVVKKTLFRIDQAKRDALHNNSLMIILQKDRPLPYFDDHSDLGDLYSLQRIRQQVNYSNLSQLRGYLNTDTSIMFSQTSGVLLTPSQAQECLPLDRDKSNRLPTKQWMLDCVREMNRCTDSYIVEYLLSQSLDSELTAEIGEIKDILTARVIYMDDCRLRLRKFVSAYNKKCNATLRLPTLLLSLSDVMCDTDGIMTSEYREFSMENFDSSQRPMSDSYTPEMIVDDTLESTESKTKSDGRPGNAERVDADVDNCTIIELKQFSGKQYFGCGMSKFHLQRVQAVSSDSKLVVKTHIKK